MERDLIESVDVDTCNGCSACVEACPLDVLRMTGTSASAKAMIVYAEDCMTCFACELCCPVDAIRVHPFKEVIASPLYPAEHVTLHG